MAGTDVIGPQGQTTTVELSFHPSYAQSFFHHSTSLIYIYIPNGYCNQVNSDWYWKHTPPPTPQYSVGTGNSVFRCFGTERTFVRYLLFWHLFVVFPTVNTPSCHLYNACSASNLGAVVAHKTFVRTSLRSDKNLVAIVFKAYYGVVPYLQRVNDFYITMEARTQRPSLLCLICRNICRARRGGNMVWTWNPHRLRKG